MIPPVSHCICLPLSLQTLSSYQSTSSLVLFYFWSLLIPLIPLTKLELFSCVVLGYSLPPHAYSNLAYMHSEMLVSRYLLSAGQITPNIISSDPSTAEMLIMQLPSQSSWLYRSMDTLNWQDTPNLP